MTDNTDKEIHHGPMMSAEQDPGKNEYATPPDLWRPLSNCVGGFDTDPCSGAESTPIAETRYTKEDNGLRQSWHGDVFVNPPWSSNGEDGPDNPKHKWFSKCRSEARRAEVDSVIVLSPSDTSSGWFHEHLLEAELLCFYGPGRLSFVGEDRNPSFGLLIACYGENAGEYRDTLTQFGSVVQGRGVYQEKTQTELFGDFGGADGKR